MHDFRMSVCIIARVILSILLVTANRWSMNWSDTCVRSPTLEDFKTNHLIQMIWMTNIKNTRTFSKHHVQTHMWHEQQQQKNIYNAHPDQSVYTREKCFINENWKQQFVTNEYFTYTKLTKIKKYRLNKVTVDSLPNKTEPVAKTKLKNSPDKKAEWND